MTHPMPNTSSTASSGCSQVDRFIKHFEKCRNREGHVKASEKIDDSVEGDTKTANKIAHETSVLDAIHILATS